MKKSVTVLYVGHSTPWVSLVRVALVEGGFNPEIVHIETESKFRAEVNESLRWRHFHVAIYDPSVPWQRVGEQSVSMPRGIAWAPHTDHPAGVRCRNVIEASLADLGGHIPPTIFCASSEEQVALQGYAGEGECVLKSNDFTKLVQKFREVSVSAPLWVSLPALANVS